MNPKTACLRKGVVAGRVIGALNELYTQVIVLDEVDLEISRGAIKDIKSNLGALKRNFKTSPEEVRAIDDGVGRIQKALRGKVDEVTRDQLKAEVRAVQTNFRKAAKTGYLNCGAPNMEAHEIAYLMRDHAFHVDAGLRPS